MLKRIKALIYKEILTLLRDKRGRIVLIVPPIVQLVIFTFAATLDVKNAPIGIINRDQGEQAFELIQRFKGSPFFSKIVYLPSIQEGEKFIENMDGVMLMVIDKPFSKNIDSGKPAEVLMILDGRKSNTTQIVAGYASSIIQRFAQDTAAKVNYQKRDTELVVRNWFNPNLLYYWYNIPSLCGIITMLVGLIVTALSIAREKELGTFDQLLVSPLGPFEILVGKTVPGIIIGMCEGTIILTVGTLFFRVPFHGSLLLFYLSLFLFVSSIVGIGLMISSIVRTQQQAVLGTFVFISPSVLLSGFATPIENMPPWLQPVTLLIPLRYFLVISKGIFLKDVDFLVIFHNLWPMLLIAIVTLAGTGAFFRRRLE